MSSGFDAIRRELAGRRIHEGILCRHCAHGPNFHEDDNGGPCRYIDGRLPSGCRCPHYEPTEQELRMRTPELTEIMRRAPRPIASLLPITPALAFAIRTQQLEPREVVDFAIRMQWLDYEEARRFREPDPMRPEMVEGMDGVAFQRLHRRFPELAQALIEPCLDPGCNGAPRWGERCTFWDLIRHLRRDHDWPMDRVAGRLSRAPR